MHRYGREYPIRKGGFELKLEPDARRVQVHSLAEMRPVFQRLEDLMRVLGFPGMDVLAVQLALHEAAANAVRHGNQGDASKHVDVSYLVTQDEVVVEVEDEGAGFDPADVPDPFLEGHVGRLNRLGLFLMRAYMNWLNFNPRGNRVTLGRRRSVP